MIIHMNHVSLESLNLMGSTSSNDARGSMCMHPLIGNDTSACTSYNYHGKQVQFLQLPQKLKQNQDQSLLYRQFWMQRRDLENLVKPAPFIRVRMSEDLRINSELVSQNTFSHLLHGLKFHTSGHKPVFLQRKPQHQFYQFR